MKTTHKKTHFLHAHPYTASTLNLNKDHVIVDRADWKWIQDNKEKVLASPELLAACQMVLEELCFGGDWENAKKMLGIVIQKATP